MEANEIIFSLSIFVSVCIIIWAVLVIRAYIKIDRND